MQKMNKHLILLATLMGGLSVKAQQPAQTADELYQEGRQLYLRSHYAAAQQTLEAFLKLPMTSLAEDMMAKLWGYLRISLERVAIWLLLMTQISRFFSSPEYMPLAGIRVVV